MIRSTKEAYSNLRGTQKDIIQIEIVQAISEPQGNTYTVNDYLIRYNEDESFVKELIHTKTVFYDNEKLEEVNAYLQANFDYSNLSKSDKDWEMIKDGLLLDTQTNLFEDGFTVYKLLPSDWIKLTSPNNAS